MMNEVKNLAKLTKSNRITFVTGTDKNFFYPEEYLKIDRFNVKKDNIELISKLRYKELINKERLSVEEKAILTIITNIRENRIILLENLFYYLSKFNKKKIISFFKKRKSPLIIISNNIEDALLCDDVMIIENNVIVLYGPKDKILLEEKKLKTLGISLPFIIDLSIQLKLYGMINKIYLTNEGLVKAIWKK